MRKIYRLFYGSMLLALGLSYMIGIILAMKSVPYPFQNSPSSSMLSALPIAMMFLVGVFMVLTVIGMTSPEEVEE